MAPNPIAIPRKRAIRQLKSHRRNIRQGPYGNGPSRAAVAILLASSIGLLASALPWARRWLLSGAAIQSSLLLYGWFTNSAVLSTVPVSSLLAAFNLVYAVASTSWLLYGVFAAACYPLVLLTCLLQFDRPKDFARRRLRQLLRGLHFTSDKIALFDLPALEIDTDTSGLFVVRGVTISLSSMTMVAHGIELGLLLADDIELSIYTDKVTIRLFRGISIDDVYGSLKGGKIEMTFGDMKAPNDAVKHQIFESNTPFLQAASGRDGTLKPVRPDIARKLTGGAEITDSSVREFLGSLTTLPADDHQARRRYEETLEQISRTSHIHQARLKVEKSKAEEDVSKRSEKETRAAVCAQLQDMPSVPHPPERSIKVTTLQTLSPPRVRRLLHRLPFLLRLLLMPVGYFHPVKVESISVAGSGKWLSTLLQQQLFKHHSSKNAQVRRLERKVMAWLADEKFCLMMSDINGLGNVPLSPRFDIVSYLHFADIMAFRTGQVSGSTDQIIHLGGADATFTVPSFLLPHHEHLLPPKPSVDDTEGAEQAVNEIDDQVQSIKAKNELEKLKEDETEVGITIHLMLPVVLDQSLLNFVAALVKATKVIETDKSSDAEDASDHSDGDSSASLAESTESSNVDSLGDTSASRAKSFARSLRQNITDGRTGERIKDAAREFRQSAKDGTKKAVGGMVNDQWIAKMVGKVAAQLESAQGDVGYSGTIPVPLAPYREAAEAPSKLLP